MIPRGFKNWIEYKILKSVLAGMTCHLVNKAVMQQNCVETLNYHRQPLEKEAAFYIIFSIINIMFIIILFLKIFMCSSVQMDERQLWDSAICTTVVWHDIARATWRRWWRSERGGSVAVSDADECRRRSAAENTDCTNEPQQLCAPHARPAASWGVHTSQTHCRVSIDFYFQSLSHCWFRHISRVSHLLYMNVLPIDWHVPS